MGRVRYCSVRLAMVLVFACGAAAEPVLPTLDGAPDKAALLERIEKAQEDVNRHKGGYVIVGRVVVEQGDDATLVNSQMKILEGGYFADATKDLTRPVGFRMHQYAPYDLALNGMEGDIVDVGEIVMHRLPESELVAVTGEIALEGDEDARQASVRFSISKGPKNTPSNGTEPRPYWPEPVAVVIDSDGVIDMNGFSPVTYYCTVEAPGFVRQGFSVDFKPGEGADIGTVLLERPSRIWLEYIVSDKAPFELEQMEEAVLSGGDRWKATPDIYGWDLEFEQEGSEIFFRYFYAPCYIEDLGEGELEDFADIDEGPTEVRPQDTLVNSGHVYLLNQAHWKRLVLFKVTIEEPD